MPIKRTKFYTKHKFLNFQSQKNGSSLKKTKKSEEIEREGGDYITHHIYAHVCVSHIMYY